MAPGQEDPGCADQPSDQRNDHHRAADQAGKQHAPEHAEEVALDRPERESEPQRQDDSRQDEKHHADLQNGLLHDEQDEEGVAPAHSQVRIQREHVVPRFEPDE